MEKYVWEGSPSQRALQKVLDKMPGNKAEPEDIERYAQAVMRFHNEGNEPSIYIDHISYSNSFKLLFIRRDYRFHQRLQGIRQTVAKSQNLI